MTLPSLFCSELDQEYFKLLFEIEAYLRMIVRWELRGIYASSWKSTIPEDVQKQVDSRRTQESEQGSVDERKSGYFSYLNLSEIKDIIVNGPLWAETFKKTWGARDIVSADFKSLIAVRNKLAHFRPITNRDKRIAYRFIEDLSYRTRNYDGMRRLSSRIDLKRRASTGAKDSTVIKLVEELNKLNGEKFLYGDSEFTLEVISHHLAINLQICAGSIDPKKFSELLVNHENIVTLARISPLGEKLEIQIPKNCGMGKFVLIVNDLEKLIENPVEGMSSEEAYSAYNINLSEGVIGWRLPFPCSFPS